MLVWQIGAGRVRLPLLTGTIPLTVTDEPLAVSQAADTWRVVTDVPAVLWATERQPEERFIATDWVNGRGALRVPAASRVGVSQTVPPGSRFTTTVQTSGSGALRFLVRWNDQVIDEKVVGGDSAVPITVDLSPWAGQSGTLHLVTAPVVDAPDGLWLMPQLQSRSSWLHAALPPTAQPADFRFGRQVRLTGYEIGSAAPGQETAVTLYWQTTQRLHTFATVFVHVLDENGTIVAQHDAQPVQNAYPLPLWPPGVLVADTHALTLPPELPPGSYRLAVGLYDPDTFVRRPAFTGAGAPLPDDRVLLPTRLAVESP